MPCTGPKSGPRKCRKDRPHCRHCRKPARCSCPAYWYPHRKGGGLCGNTARQNEIVYGPEPGVPF